MTGRRALPLLTCIGRLSQRLVVSVLISALPFAAAAQSSGTAIITGPASVVDGDGLKIGPTAIRLHGIDAPETAQRCPAASGGCRACGEDATALLEALAGGEEVVCAARDRDRYGRIVASCEVDGRDLATEIVRAGLAWAYVEYSQDYVGLEAEARAAGRGVWQVEAEPP